MIIRQATEQDWPLIYPIYAAIMAEGKTYPFPQGQSLDEARPWWMEEPPGQTVVAVADGVIVGSAIVRLVERHAGSPALVSEVGRFLAELKAPLRGTGAAR